MIKFENVSKIFQQGQTSHHAVKDIHLEIQSHEAFGIIGKSGAGKSTLLRFLNKLESPTNGKIWVDDLDISQLSGKQARAYLQSIGTIFQHFNLLENLTVEENILLPLKLHDFAEVLDLDEVLQFVGLEDKRHAYPAKLSGGQKQRVGIARALITKPRILLCDEPTSALDEATQLEIIQLLSRVHQSYNMTLLIVSHQLNVIKELCQRAVFMEEGRIVEIFDVKAKTQGKANTSYLDHVRDVLSHE